MAGPWARRSNHSIHFHSGVSGDQILRYKKILVNKIRNIGSAKRGSVVIVQGDMGIGKSRLLLSTISEVSDVCQVILSQGNEYDLNTPLSIWKDILLQLLDAHASKPVPVAASVPPPRPPPRPKGARESTVPAKFRPSHVPEQPRKRRVSVHEVKMDDDEEEGMASKAQMRRSLILRRLNDRAKELGSGIQLGALAPVLNVVLPSLGFPDTPFTIDLEPDERINYAQNIMIYIFQALTNDKPLLAVIDDAMYLDAMSWRLILEMSRSVDKVLFLCATRPINKLYMAAFATSVPKSYTTLLSEPQTKVLRFQKWTDKVIERILLEELGTHFNLEPASIVIPPPLLKLIVSRAQGTPLIVKELVYALKKKGLIGSVPWQKGQIIASPILCPEVSEDSVIAAPVSPNNPSRISTPGNRPSTKRFSMTRKITKKESDKKPSENNKKHEIGDVVVPIPVTLQNILGTRLDRLSSVQCMVLKVGAMIAATLDCDSFSFHWLVRVFPLPLDGEEHLLREAVLALQDYNIIRGSFDLDKTGPRGWELSYQFVNGFMRDLCLSRMLIKQKNILSKQLNLLKMKDSVDSAHVFYDRRSLGLCCLLGPIKIRWNGEFPGIRVDTPLMEPKENCFSVPSVDPAQWLECWGVLQQEDGRVGCITIWMNEEEAENADDPNRHAKPIVAISLPHSCKAQAVIERENVAISLPHSCKAQAVVERENAAAPPEFCFEVESDQWMWEGDFYNGVQLRFTIATRQKSEGVVWLDTIRESVRGRHDGVKGVTDRRLTTEQRQATEVDLLREVNNRDPSIELPTTLLSTQKQHNLRFASGWKKRYVTLTSSCLVFRKKNRAPNHSKYVNPVLVLDLNYGDVQVSATGDVKKVHHTFEVRVDVYMKHGAIMWDSGVFVLACSTVTEQQSFVDAIQKVIDKNRSARQAKRIERSRASNKTRGMAAIQEDDHDDFEVDSEIIRATCVIHRELKETKSLSSLNSKSQSRIARSHTKQ